MNKQHQFSWQTAWGTIAIVLGIGITGSPAIAFPQQADSFKLAQVGVGSRINAPTPLNIRPRTHIPLPRSRYNRYGYPKYRDYYRSDRYRYDRDCDRHYDHRRNRGGTVIIINPSNHDSYDNYDGYIRIIRK